MSRGIGALESIQNAIPDWLAVVIALLTQLGDVWFLALVLAALYWIDAPRRDDVATLGGVWLAAMGLYLTVKELLALPRPARPLLEPELLPVLVRPAYEATALATGYGFPSGHAVNATVVYVGLAYLLGASTRRRRFAGATALVATVCFTRVALGVHYLVDVVAGVAVGAVLFLAALPLLDRDFDDRTTVAFGLAVAAGIVFLATSRVDEDAILLLAASLGAFAGWQLVVLARRLATGSRSARSRRPVVVRGGSAALALASLVAALGYVPLRSVYAAGGVLGIVVATAVAFPVVREPERVRGRFRGRSR